MNNFIKEFQSFDNDELINFLKKNGFDEFCDIIKSKAYDGNTFLNLTEFGMTLWIPRKSMQQRKKLWNFLTDLKFHPEKYFEVENDEIYENHQEECNNKVDIFKKNIKELTKNDAFIHKFKTALKEKEKEIRDNVSSDSFDSDDEVYVNDPPLIESKLPAKLPPKPKILPKPNSPNTITPSSITSPSKSPIKTTIPISIFDKIEEHLKKEVKRNEDMNKKDSVVLRNPHKSSENSNNLIESNQLNVPSSTRIKSSSSIPTLPTKDNYDAEDKDEDLPEYLDIDEEDADDQKVEMEPKIENTILPRLKIRYDDIKRRPLPPLPPLPPLSPDSTEVYPKKQYEAKGNTIQKVPLPPIPDNTNSLPRPPKNILNIGSICIEDFNFEHSFVSKYSKAEFYRHTDRKGSERLLMQPNVKNGMYLVRPSHNHYCTISVKYNERVYQLAIYKGEGTKVMQSDVEYDSLEYYLEYYKNVSLCLPNKNGYVNVYLTDPLPHTFT